MKSQDQTIKVIGEQGLLKFVQKFCPSNIIGDDGAVIATDPKQRLVTTSDMLVQNVHFSDLTTSNYDIGWRSAAVNLSDLAAMGAKPLGLMVALSLPPDTNISFVEKLYQGLADCCQKYNCPIIGGDLCKSSIITVCITALGQVIPDNIISRFTAQRDDLIVVTGNHGSSKGGLELLLNNCLSQGLNLEEKQELIIAHQQPQPRLDVIPLLWENNNKITVSGMDSSDGLADAVIQICRCSKVGAQIDANLIPISASLKKLVGENKALEYALYGGEDYELVLCLPATNAKILVNNLGKNAKIIGKITEAKEVKLIDNTGKFTEQILSLDKGFQHF